MNFDIFVEAFTTDELNQLNNAILKVQRRMILSKLNDYTLTDDERNIFAEKGIISTILAFRQRNNISLMEAKVIVESLLRAE